MDAIKSQVGQRYRGICFGIVGISCIIGSGAIAQPQRPLRLCVLSQAALMRDSLVAQRAMIEFRSLRGRVMNDIATAAAAVDADARSLDQLGASFEPELLQARRMALERRKAEIRAHSDAQARELDTYNSRLTAKVNQAAAPSIMAEEAARGCSMLFSREYLLNVADASLDITPAVLARMNATPSNRDAAKSRR